MVKTRVSQETEDNNLFLFFILALTRVQFDSFLFQDMDYILRVLFPVTLKQIKNQVSIDCIKFITLNVCPCYVTLSRLNDVENGHQSL